jgi:hypothetical protein
VFRSSFLNSERLNGSREKGYPVSGKRKGSSALLMDAGCQDHQRANTMMEEGRRQPDTSIRKQQQQYYH